MHRKWAAVIAGGALLLAGCKTTAGADGSTTPVWSPTPSTPAAASSSPALDRTVHAGGHAFPDHTLTPGATIAGVTAAQVCTSGWASRHRHVTTALRHQVFAAYGIPYSTHSKYELDHLIPLELGGSNSQRNLWPEVLTDDDSSGPSKDALENHLHALVCSGQLGLHTAQDGISHDWMTMWGLYEHVKVHRRAATHHSSSGSSGSSGSSSSGSSGGSSGSSSSGGSSSGGSSSHGGATAKCNDGTLSYSAHHQGTCSHHDGVAVWYK